MTSAEVTLAALASTAMTTMNCCSPMNHRAKLVHLRTSLRCQIHAVLANHGIRVPVSDLFGVEGIDCSNTLRCHRQRVAGSTPCCG